MSIKDMERSKLVLIGIVALTVVGLGVGLGFAFAGPSKDKTTTTTIKCKTGTDDCTVEGATPSRDPVGPGEGPDSDQWKKDQKKYALDMPWADYNGRDDISNLHPCDPTDTGDRDLCYSVTNHSKWRLDYELDLTYYDSSGARIGTDTLSTYDVGPGQVDKTAERQGSGTMMPDGAAKYTLDSVKILGSDCAESGACDEYEAPGH